MAEESAKLIKSKNLPEAKLKLSILLEYSYSKSFGKGAPFQKSYKIKFRLITWWIMFM